MGTARLRHLVPLTAATLVAPLGLLQAAEAVEPPVVPRVVYRARVTGFERGAELAVSADRHQLLGSLPGEPGRFLFVSTAPVEPYGHGFRGGVSVAFCHSKAANDVFELTGAGAGGGPHVRLWRFAEPQGGGFFAYDPGFRGGVDVACADLDGDGEDEIITGAGPGGGPNVRVFDLRGRLLSSFFAYDPAFRGGVRVAGEATTRTIVTGPGPGGGPNVRTFRGGTLVGSAFCFEPSDSRGLDVATGDADGDGGPDVVCSDLSGPSRFATLPLSLDTTRPPVATTALDTGRGVTGASVAAVDGRIVSFGRSNGSTEITEMTGRPDRPGVRVYASDTYGQRGYTMLVDGGQPSDRSPVTPTESSWLADGRRRLVPLYQTNSTFAHDGSDERPASFPHSQGAMAVATNRPVVAYVRDSDGDLVTATTDGTIVRELTSGSGNREIDRLAIDPDAQWVVLEAFDGNHTSLRVAETARSAGTAGLTFPPSGVSDLDAAVSAQGQVAYCRGDDLRVIRVDGSGDHIAVAGGGCKDPAWSADGTKIAFSKVAGTVVTSPQGGAEVFLGLRGYPSWEPSGRRLAIGEYGEGRLAIVNADGSGTPRIIGDNARYVAWEPLAASSAPR